MQIEKDEKQNLIIAILDDSNRVVNTILGDAFFLIKAGLSQEKHIFAANCVKGCIFNHGTNSFINPVHSNTKSFPNDGKLYHWDEETGDYKELIIPDPLSQEE